MFVSVSSVSRKNFDICFFVVVVEECIKDVQPLSDKVDRKLPAACGLLSLQLVSQLISDYIKREIDNGKLCEMVVLDLQRAFNTTDY